MTFACNSLIISNLWVEQGEWVYLHASNEAEIDHSSLTHTEKENQKRQWKQWIDATTHGFKDKLKEEGRLA